MDWQTVWDIRNTSPADFLPFVYMGGAMLAVAAGFALFARSRGRRSQTARVIALFAVLLAGLGYGINTWDRNRLLAHLEKGEVQVIEGMVTGHQVWRQDAARSSSGQRRYNTWETIYVAGVQFTWTPGAEEPAFTNRAPGNLPFQDGMVVRVHWVEDVEGEAHQRRIVWLEAAGDAASAAALPEAPYPSVAVPQ